MLLWPVTTGDDLFAFIVRVLSHDSVSNASYCCPLHLACEMQAFFLHNFRLFGLRVRCVIAFSIFIAIFVRV
jgi:hypothetical protein